jgi:hypothetical protein
MNLEVGQIYSVEVDESLKLSDVRQLSFAGNIYMK